MYYDRNGKPLDLWEWARAIEDPEQKRVAHDKIGFVEVSTLWLGLDHDYGSDGPPLIFETTVFGGGLDDAFERYSTEEEALAGHAAMVARVRAKAAEDGEDL